jgi:D-arginine dehydrogenase
LSTVSTADFAVIGAGIAGASIAYELAAHGSVALLEAEPRPGYHATGRSAALFSETYGNGVVRALSAASRAFLESPPDYFEAPILTPRGAVHVGTEQHAEPLRAFVADCQTVQPSVRLIGRDEILALVPVLKPEFAAVGAYEPDAREIETARMHSGFLRGFKQRGGELLVDAPVQRLQTRNGVWRVDSATRVVQARFVVNAAGAWADSMAQLAGIPPLGLQPLRRTAVIVPGPDNTDVRPWPMVIDADEQYYFKPDADRLLVSPADETPSPAVDASPDDMDIAIAVDRFESATTMSVKRVEHSWAGLRTFAPDRSPVVGLDPRATGFLWFAGQGGYGFQLAAALARAGAAIVTGTALPADIARHGITAAQLGPGRFLS